MLSDSKTNQHDMRSSSYMHSWIAKPFAVLSLRLAKLGVRPNRRVLPETCVVRHSKYWSFLYSCCFFHYHLAQTIEGCHYHLIFVTILPSNTVRTITSVPHCRTLSACVRCFLKHTTAGKKRRQYASTSKLCLRVFASYASERQDDPRYECRQEVESCLHGESEQFWPASNWSRSGFDYKSQTL